MSNRRGPLKKAEFYNIIRAVRSVDNPKPVDFSIIGQSFGVSTQTVRAVHHAKTWPQYERNKQARRAPVERQTTRLPAGTAVMAADSVAPMTSSKSEHTIVVEIKGEDLDNILTSINDHEERLQKVEEWRDGILQREKEEGRIKEMREHMEKKDALPRRRPFSLWGRRK